MTQTLSVEFWPIDDIAPSPRNARLHDDAQVEQIARSIQEFGFTNPILIDEDGTIVACSLGREGPAACCGHPTTGRAFFRIP